MTQAYYEGFRKTAEEYRVNLDNLIKIAAGPHIPLLKLLLQAAKSGKVTRRLALALSSVKDQGSSIERANKALNTFSKMKIPSKFNFFDPDQHITRRFWVGKPGAGIQISLPRPELSEKSEALSRVAQSLKDIHDKGYRFYPIEGLGRKYKYFNRHFMDSRPGFETSNYSLEWVKRVMKDAKK